MRKSLLLLLFCWAITFAATAQLIEKQSIQSIQLSQSSIAQMLSFQNINPPQVTIHYKKKKARLVIPNLPLPDAGNQVKEFTGQTQLTNVVLPHSPAPATGFTGVIDNISYIPPDVNGAVGPNHVITTLNGQIGIQDRAGNTLASIDPLTFFSSAQQSGSLFDPKILYDPNSQRFIMVYLDGSGATSNILLAVSLTNSAMGSWYLYRIKTNVDNTNLWLDFPTVGLNKDWIVVSGNMFSSSGSFDKVKVFAIKKSDAIAGSSTLNGGIFSITDGGFTIAPAVVADNTTPFVPLMCVWNNAQGTYRLYKITGTTTPALEARNYPSLGAANAWFPYTFIDNGAPQQSMTDRSDGMDDGDNRMCNLMYRNGKIWATHTQFFSNTGNFDASSIYRGAIRWMALDTTGVISQTGKLEDANVSTVGAFQVPTNSFAYPSIAVNANEDVLIGFAHFSPTQYGSASYMIRQASDPAGTMQSLYQFKTGLAHYSKDYGGGRNRWGDYSATMLDPTNDLYFWTIGEYAETFDNNSGYDRWGTYWSQVIPCSIPNGGSVAASATVCPTNSGTLTLSGHLGTILRWESSTDNFTNTNPIVNTGTTQNYTNLSQTTQYRAVVQNGTCPAANATAATITVLNPAIPVASGATINAGNSVTLTATGCTGSVGTFQLKWYKSADNSAVTMPISPSVTTDYYAKCEQMLNTVTCASAKSADVSVTVIQVQIIYVNVANSNAGQDGTTWNKAFNDLQAGLTAAANATGLVEVWVAQGTYKTTNTTDRTIAFNLSSGVKLYGGFVGNETALTQRNFRTNETILSGDISTLGVHTDNTYHILKIINANNQTTIDGFTIKYGYAANQPPVSNSPQTPNAMPNPPVSLESGGGVYVQNSSPSIVNCNLQSNVGIFGAGIFSEANSATKVLFCKILGNFATFGGGVYNLNSNTIFYNVFMAGNKGLGGAMYNNNANPMLANVTIAGNSGFIGSIYNTPNAGIVSMPTIKNGIIWNNTGAIGPAVSNITYSIVQGGYTGIGNVNLDPLFVASQPTANAPTIAGDYHVQANSIATDAGNNGSISLTDLDLDGNLRRYNGGRVDMGAYEFQGNATATIVISITSGNWEDASTWDLGRVPLAKDVVIIDQNHQVMVNTIVEAQHVQYRGNGKVKFANATAKVNLGY